MDTAASYTITTTANTWIEGFPTITTNSSCNEWISYPAVTWSQPIVVNGPIIDQPEKKAAKKKIEGVEYMVLYDVYLVYGENRKSPVVIREHGVIARDEEDAKIKSGLMAKVENSWDADYLTFVCNEIGEVKVKEKPKEVKGV